MENGKYQISFAPIYGQEIKNEEEKKTEDPGTDSVEDAVSRAEEAVRSISADGSLKRNSRRYGRCPDIGQRARTDRQSKIFLWKMHRERKKKTSESLL